MKDMRKWKSTFTALQAYETMRKFIKVFGKLVYSENAAYLYKALELSEHGVTVDPVFLHKWAWCIHKILTEKTIDYFRVYPDGILPKPYKDIKSFPEVIQDPNQIITYLEGYNAARKFLDIYYFETYSDDIGLLVSSMAILPPEGPPIDQAMWSDWLRAIRTVLKKDKLAESILK